MNRRFIFIAVLSCLLVLTGTAGYTLSHSTKPVPARLILENSNGSVVFTHAEHSTPGSYGSVSCSACHHELVIAHPASTARTPDAALAEIAKHPNPAISKHAGTGGGSAAEKEAAAHPSVMRCSACHGAAETPGFVALHQEKYRAQAGDASCTACHHTRFAGLTAGWNHEAHESYASNRCTTCHHPAIFEYAPGKNMEHKPQKCSNCHTSTPQPGSLASTTLKDASHIRCESCHTAPLEEKMKGCPSCHIQASTAADPVKGSSPVDPSVRFEPCSRCHGPIPARKDAFHKSCKSCHDKAGKGPGSKAECGTCHKGQKEGRKA